MMPSRKDSNMRILLTLLLISSVTLPVAADWRQFRGSGATGSHRVSDLPETWDAEKENVAWKVELPGRGPSSPIVLGDKVVVTTASGADLEQLHVLCYSTEEGHLLWQRNFWATGRTFCHSQSTPAAPSPVSDGEYVYAFFGSNDLVCLDLEGNLKWYRGLGFEHPKAGNDVGMASSPLIVDDTVIVQIENQGDSFAAGIDAKTGQTRWFLPREEKANGASPIVLGPSNSAKPSVVLLQSGKGVTAVAANSGEVLWEMGGGASTISSSLSDKGRAYLVSNGLVALELQDPTVKPKIVWEVNKLNPNSMSPVLADGKVFVINGAGVLTCGDAETGDILWPLRLKGPFWASPVVAGGKLYAPNFGGTVFVVDVSGKKGKIVNEISMRENIQATPAVDGDAMYLKGERHLWKIARTK